MFDVRILLNSQSEALQMMMKPLVGGALTSITHPPRNYSGIQESEFRIQKKGLLPNHQIFKSF